MTRTAETAFCRKQSAVERSDPGCEDTMINGKKVVGIITEYNPFHAGHQYMINQIRAEYLSLIHI